MARKEARLFTGIWAEPGWRALSSEAQWLYLFLISQPDLAHDGVISLRERRWASNAADLTAKEISRRVEELEKAGYIISDDATEEVLIRAFMRRDEIYLQPNLMKSAVAHLPGVESHRIRRALYAEAARIVRENSDRVRTAAELPVLTEKQKVPIRMMVEILRRTGDGPAELESAVRVQPVEIPEEAMRQETRSHGTRPSPDASTVAEATNDPDPSTAVDSGLVTGLGRELGLTSSVDTPPYDVDDPLRPAGSNPSADPSQKPLGDRVSRYGSEERSPYLLSPRSNYPPIVPHGDQLPTQPMLDFESGPAARVVDEGPPDPLLADFGPTPDPEQVRSGASSAFERFWAVYPLKIKKGYAQRCWDKAIKRATPEQIIRGAKRYAEDPNRSEAYTAHPSSWLNQGRWEDDPLPARGGGLSTTRPGATAALDAAARRRAARTAGGEITDGRR